MSDVINELLTGFKNFVIDIIVNGIIIIIGLIMLIGGILMVVFCWENSIIVAIGVISTIIGTFILAFISKRTGNV